MKLKVAVPDSLGALLPVNFGDSRFPGSWSLRLQPKAPKVTSSLRQTPRREKTVQKRTGLFPASAWKGPSIVLLHFHQPQRSPACTWGSGRGHTAPPPGCPWAGGGSRLPLSATVFQFLGGSPQSAVLVAAAAKSLQSCPTLRSQRWQPSRRSVVETSP